MGQVQRGPGWARLLIYTLLIGLTAVYLYPVLWLGVNSLKNTSEIFGNPWGFPQKALWENYQRAWTVGRIGVYFVNSAVITVGSIGLMLLVGSTAAFAIKRLKWRGADLALGFFSVGIMIPLHAVLLPLFVWFTRAHLVNTRVSLIIAYAAFNLPVAILILCGFFESIPRELEEAAIVDGCTVGQVFWQIILPVSKSALLVVSIFSFVSIWNELLVALIFVSDPGRMTLPVGLANFRGEYATNFAPLLAAVMITMVPSIIVYSILSDRIIEGMTAGALKG